MILLEPGLAMITIKKEPGLLKLQDLILKPLQLQSSMAPGSVQMVLLKVPGQRILKHWMVAGLSLTEPQEDLFSRTVR